MAKLWYTGPMIDSPCDCSYPQYGIFQTSSIPTKKSHGHLCKYVFGGYRTREKAENVASYQGRKSPFVEIIWSGRKWTKEV